LLNDYHTEKQSYVNLIAERAAIFHEEAQQVGLPLYPYKEGFFMTIPIPQERVESTNLLLQQHDIYLVEVAAGLRLALCSVPKTKLRGLAKRINDILRAM